MNNYHNRVTQYMGLQPKYIIYKAMCDIALAVSGNDKDILKTHVNYINNTFPELEDRLSIIEDNGELHLDRYEENLDELESLNS